MTNLDMYGRCFFTSKGDRQIVQNKQIYLLLFKNRIIPQFLDLNPIEN